MIVGLLLLTLIQCDKQTDRLTVKTIHCQYAVYKQSLTMSRRHLKAELFDSSFTWLSLLHYQHVCL